MKKSILVFALMFTAHINAQKNIVVAIAVGKTDCRYSTSDDLGYQVYTSNSKAKADKLATEKVKRSHPNYKSLAVEHNGYDANYGNHIVIIEAKTKYQGCDKYTYGVGFGFNKSDALRNAKKSLGMRNWNWVESKHGYRQVYYKYY